ncbi:MAG: sialidase family protein [Pirellulales bacterium]
MRLKSKQHRFVSAAARRVSWAVIAAAVVHCSAAAEVMKVTVFNSGQDGYHTYRIPAIVQAQNGDLLAFAEGRKNGSGDAGDIDLVMKRSTDDGKTWSSMQLVQDEWSNPTASVTIGNPAPVVDLMDPAHPGRIWLPFSRNNSRVFVTYSDDDGATWSDRAEITSTAKKPNWGWYATGPVHGIQLERGAHAGRLIIPSDHRDASTGAWGSHVLYSSDHGQTWQVGAVDTHPLSSPILPNENVAVELVDGRIYFNAREHNGTDPATRAIAHSSDGGLTYDAPFVGEPNITTPVVQNSAVRFAATDRGDDRNMLVYSGPGHPTSRRDLTILVSFDEGTSWIMDTVLHVGPAAYSDLVKLNSEQLGVLYEAGSSLYQEIVFATFGLEDLNPEPWNGIPGDVDQNGVLDAVDLEAFVNAWKPVHHVTYLGGWHSYTHGDLNFNGINDLGDVFLMRQALLGQGLSAASLEPLLTVPEPPSLLLVVGLGVIRFGFCCRSVRYPGLYD